MFNVFDAQQFNSTFKSQLFFHVSKRRSRFFEKKKCDNEVRIIITKIDQLLINF